MPNDKVLNSKKEQVAELVAKLKDATSCVLVSYKGIDVATDTKLRTELRKENIYYAVVKNTLISLACKELGFDEFQPHLVGTTSIAIADDETSAARILQKYVPKNKEGFDLKAGRIGTKFMDKAELRAIATLPSREVLVAQVAGSLNGIIASLARAISEVAKKNAA